MDHMAQKDFYSSLSFCPFYARNGVGRFLFHFQLCLYWNIFAYLHHNAVYYFIYRKAGRDRPIKMGIVLLVVCKSFGDVPLGTSFQDGVSKWSFFVSSISNKHTRYERRCPLMSIIHSVWIYANLIATKYYWNNRIEHFVSIQNFENSIFNLIKSKQLDIKNVLSTKINNFNSDILWVERSHFSTFKMLILNTLTTIGVDRSSNHIQASRVIAFVQAIRNVKY